ncbi:hypothetical protein [Cerasicoccus fimbriatus]|uniref:hypothetical protein n=1 Tax=Cerasicoccus fimbriatus TaxID=3014554 RepID=UPI0022B4049B|nr:hypothetical protein [Cerasicoccus sp. TK19100]
MLSPKLPHSNTFDWLIANPGKRTFKRGEVGKLLCLSPDSVQRLIDQGELWGICHESMRGSGQRRSYAITRDSILCYLGKTADHDEEMKVEMLCRALDTIQCRKSIKTIYSYLADRISQMPGGARK